MCFSIAGRTENNLTILNITTFGHVKLTLVGTILSSPFHHWEFNENFSPCPFFSSLNSRWSLRRGYTLSSVIFSWLLNVACSFKGDTEFNEKFLSFPCQHILKTAGLQNCDFRNVSSYQNVSGRTTSVEMAFPSSFFLYLCVCVTYSAHRDAFTKRCR